MPEHPSDKPAAEPERRSTSSSAPTLIMQGYEKMGTAGRRRLLWIGLAMVTAGGGVGLFASALSFYRFIIVLVFVAVGSAFIFPQYGILFLEKILNFIPKIGPMNLLSRPDRRDNGDE